MKNFAIIILSIFSILIAACATAPVPTQVAYDRTWPAWNKVVATDVHEDGVDYAALKADPADLNAALAEFEAVRPETYAAWPDPDRLAFLIDVHNAFAIKRIVDHWPVRSIEGTKFFGSALEVRDIPVAGRMWSLADLQRQIMGPEFLESRALFLLNWGARGCPPLPTVAVTGENISDLLERQPKRFLADPEYITYDEFHWTAHLSPLLEQYQDALIRDFTTWQIFLQRYLPPEQAKFAKLRPPRVRFGKFDGGVNVVHGK